ncbi:GNAT family N-acetyltransferase [Peterkaempfera sp. SMS 1(5)a]|uniref:GNAT family N-acetyltransferase n=1 Tax=Peterkaempfera podocarpi TaxID=3232308 RepID=UPI0036720905
MQGQSAHPAARDGRVGRSGGDPVRLCHRPQPGAAWRRGPRSSRRRGPLGRPRLRRGRCPMTTVPPADLLDGVGGWGVMATAAGAFRLRPVRLPDDLPLLSGWMNDPAVAEFWHLDGPSRIIEEHLRVQLDGDGRSVPCLGVLGGRAMSYWEVYRADLDPLARHYPARPHDTGIHLLLGPADTRGRGLGSLLLRALADRVLRVRPACDQVVAEPDIRNLPSVAAFGRAGFRRTVELQLPDKRAVLMVRRRIRPTAGALRTP